MSAETTATLRAAAILSELLEIERSMGRERTYVNGPRIIDLDLLLLGDKIVARSKSDGDWSFLDGNGVFVPHPRMHLRRFVLEPLCEIAPDLVHPILKAPVRELLARVGDKSRVRLHAR